MRVSQSIRACCRRGQGARHGVERAPGPAFLALRSFLHFDRSVINSVQNRMKNAGFNTASERKEGGALRSSFLPGTISITIALHFVMMIKAANSMHALQARSPWARSSPVLSGSRGNTPLRRLTRHVRAYKGAHCSQVLRLGPLCPDDTGRTLRLADWQP